MRSLLALPLIAVLATLGAGCGSDSAGSSADPALLEGTSWVLASGTAVTPVEGVAISATFAEGTVSGIGGCNNYSGPFTITGETVTTGPIRTTEIACEDGINKAEQAYLDALGQVARWRLDGDELVLSDSAGTELLRYSAASPVGTWTLVNLNTGKAITGPVDGTVLTATFGADGTLSGSAGCNNYTGSYTAERGALTVSQLASTKKICTEPEGASEQEAAYLTALPTATRYSLGGALLTLTTGDGTIVAVYSGAK